MNQIIVCWLFFLVDMLIRWCLSIIVYSYNPCKPFSEKPYCENVAACQSQCWNRFPFKKKFVWCLVALDGLYHFTIGVQDSAIWHPGSETDKAPSVTYTHGEKRSVVELQCSTTGEEDFEVLGEGPINHFTFRITHKCACWNGCSSKWILEKRLVWMIDFL